MPIIDYEPSYVPKAQWVSDSTIIEAADMKQIDDVMVKIETALAQVAPLIEDQVNAVWVQVNQNTNNIASTKTDLSALDARVTALENA